METERGRVGQTARASAAVEIFLISFYKRG